ncbi:MAG: hypothetical protein KGL36_03125 [Gammaproteobacteria bacterium]|nr:hypothetical protein [Gammaproteobacteria bacterium]
MSGVAAGPPRSPPVDLEIDADHPAYAGHFPGDPVLPGVVLLDAALRRLADDGRIDAGDCEILWFKFSAPVRPHDRVVLETDEDASGTLRVRIVCGPRTVATGALRSRPRRGAP